MTTTKIFRKILEGFVKFRNCDKDSEHAKEYFDYHEYEVLLYFTINQLYEYDCKIDNAYYILLLSALTKFKKPTEEIDFMKELIVL